MKIKNKLKVILSSVFFLILVIGATYAYLGTFNINLNNNVAVNINSTSPGNTSFIANSTQLNIQVPDTSMAQYNANNNVAAKEDTGFVDVTLTGAEGFLTTCSYDLVYEYNTNSDIYGKTVPVTSGATKEITIEVNGMNGNNHFATETNFNFNTSNGWSNATSSTGAKVTLVTGATLKSLGTEQSVRWKVIGRYYNLDLNQYALSGKSFTGKIYVENVNCSTEDGTTVKKGYETILANNGGAASMTTLTSTDFANATTASEKGMYKATDDLGTSYYFRGAVDNNWVKYGKYTKDTYVNYYEYDVNYGDVVESGGFVAHELVDSCDGKNPDDCYKIASKGDDIYWRIIRINGDNSIRMIYAGTYAPDNNTKVTMTEQYDDGNQLTQKTSIGYSRFNENCISSECVGYMYTIGQQHGTGTSNMIKTYLDNWYANYTSLNATGTMVTDQIYCNDRTASTSNVVYSEANYTTLTSWNSTGTHYYYGGYGRIVKDNNPMLTCAVDSDRFTVNKINGKGNSALTYPVGLITIDELEMAGNRPSGDNTSFYLYTGDYYWTSSPYEFSRTSYEFGDNGGYLGPGIVIGSAYGVRGVVSLSSDVKLLGSGTYDDVYTVN